MCPAYTPGHLSAEVAGSWKYQSWHEVAGEESGTAEQPVVAVGARPWDIRTGQSACRPAAAAAYRNTCIRMYHSSRRHWVAASDTTAVGPEDLAGSGGAEGEEACAEAGIEVAVGVGRESGAAGVAGVAVAAVVAEAVGMVVAAVAGGSFAQSFADSRSSSLGHTLGAGAGAAVAVVVSVAETVRGAKRQEARREPAASSVT